MLYRTGCILTGYLCGCFLTAEAVSRHAAGKSASRLGTGNPGMANIMTNVANAISISAPMINGFLWYRSAHTPPAKEMRNCGR